MKKIFYLLILLSACQVHRKPTYIPQVYCDSLFFNLESGKINEVSPMLSQEEIKEWLPCYTKVSPHGATEDCGGGVLFQNHGFNFFTYFDFVEVYENFKGKTSGNLLGKTREEVRKAFPQPIDTKYKTDRPEIDFFSRTYGCLSVHYKNDKVVRVGGHYNDCLEVEICH